MGDTRKLLVGGVSPGFGLALDDDGFRVRLTEIAITGPHRAGNTGLLNCIEGFLRSQQGRICSTGRVAFCLLPHERVSLCMASVFQHIVLFPGLTTPQHMLATQHMYLNNNFPWAGQWA